MRPETAAIHIGVNKDGEYGSVTTPIYQTSNFHFPEPGHSGEYRYTRLGNPTTSAWEENLAALEGGVFARATGSGMAATSAALLLLQQGDHVIAPRDVYGGTFHLFHDYLPRLGLEFTWVDMQDPEEVRKALQPETRMIWIETPSNPLLKVVDISAVVEVAREAEVMTAADNTFLTPYFQRPLDLGVDIVVHSATKYLNGHSDVVGGAVVTGDRKLGGRLKAAITAYGLGEAPFDSWLVLRGVKTLAARMEAHQRNAFAVARFLKGHESVRSVHFPGLEDDPGHGLAKQQQSGFGGVVTFELETRAVEPRDFFARLKFFALAASLGGVESLVGHPWTMSHSTMPPEEREKAGISKGTVRLSVGIEHPDDLVEELDRALEA